MITNQTDYDVIIVGGRVSGSTLAAYLGKSGIRVLLLERDELPQKHPASSPIVQPVTLSMLDEIGADETQYARNTAKIQRMYAIDGDLNWQMDIPKIDGRDYAYAVDRARFDAALWENAVRYPSVDGLMRFSVTNLLWDQSGKSVIGVSCKNLEDGSIQDYTAKVVVGADGRFSMVARKVEAQETDKHEKNPTTAYYAYWQNVEQIQHQGQPIPTSSAYGSPTGTHGYLIMDSADDTAAVVVEGRADVIEPSRGEIEAFYLQKLAENRAVWARLENATMSTSVHGMRKIGNMFRQAGGPGWALTGDAYHQKDPIDGQGIYDAVYTSRTLANAISKWLSGDKTWAEAITWYDAEARAEMKPQYEMTLSRIQQNLYPKVALPRQLIETPLRWLTRDQQYSQIAGMALNRQIDPREAAKPRFLAIAMLRGGLRELSDKLATE